MILSAAYWELWKLNHKITVDPYNKRLIVGPDVATLNIKEDIYSDYKEWFKLNNNSGYAAIAIRTVGGDPTVSGEFAGDIYFLQNGWRLIIDPRVTRISGSLFSDDYDTAYAVPVTFEPFYPVQVSSLITQVQPDLSALDIPSAVDNAQANWEYDATLSSDGSYGDKVKRLLSFAQFIGLK